MTLLYNCRYTRPPILLSLSLLSPFVSCLHIPSLISHHPATIYRLPSPVSRLPSPVSHHPSPVSRLLPSPISRLLSPISHLPTAVSCLPSPTFRHQMHLSLLPSLPLPPLPPLPPPRLSPPASPPSPLPPSRPSRSQPACSQRSLGQTAPARLTWRTRVKSSAAEAKATQPNNGAGGRRLARRAGGCRWLASDGVRHSDETELRSLRRRDQIMVSKENRAALCV